MLKREGKKLLVTVAKPGDFQIASPTMVDRTGRPLFCAAVQIRKSYVSYHLMPIYASKALRDSLSPALEKRMQGKGCFNFTTVEPDQLKELAQVTRRGIAGFKHFKLPWAQRSK